MIKILLLVVILLFSPALVAGENYYLTNENKIEELSNSKEWKALLHYTGNKSIIKDKNFFLSLNGNENPKAELIRTLEEYIHPTQKGEEDIICKFPARVSFIESKFKIHKRTKSNCKGFNEFKQKVPFENISIIFAGENNLSPSSMMGHMFLKLSGKVNGITREHSFSFFATLKSNSAFLNYLNILTNNIEGYYILSPYRNKAEEYISTEQRPLWEFKLKLTKKEKEFLFKHIWELKEKELTYSFINHNCGNATINLIKITNPDIVQENRKPWHTPIEYIDMFFSENKISDISLEPSTEYKNKIAYYGEIKNITDITPSSKVSIGFQHNTVNLLTFEFRPVYSDIKDFNELSYDQLETKIFSFEGNFNLERNKIYLNKIDIFKARSILDFIPNKSFSKHFAISLENNLFENHTSLKPTLETGLGISFGNKNFVNFYFLPQLGYRYNKVNNFYLTPEAGVILQPLKQFKMIGSFNSYIDSKENNRGYKKKVSLSVRYKINKKISLELETNRFFDTKINNQNEIWFKTGLFF